ncbi:MAG TPA: hypothetical protein VD968_17375 [Pyrinomonadaceae bacterium]|nr:hypothetical protein [Pyrinomonadaceae bacterium]
MKRLLRLRVVWVLAAAALAIPAGRALSQGGGPEERARHARALEEALAELRLHPRDAYLQYVALQLARRSGRFDEVAAQVDAMIPHDGPVTARERSRDVDLFGVFTGALAVQESLQLDTMRVATTGTREAPPPSATAVNMNGPLPPGNFNGNVNMTGGRRRPQRRGRARARARQSRPPARAGQGNVNAPPPPWMGNANVAALPRYRRDERVAVSALEGPTVKSHPWEKMLAGRRPEVTQLARSVPEDFYLAEFRTLTKLLDTVDAGDLWATHLFNQAFGEAKSSGVGDRLKRQLAIETDPLTRPFYDLVVEGVAAAGSDLFVREGSDVTLLFRVKQPLVFNLRMGSFLDNAERSNPKAVRTTGDYMGVPFVQIVTPERDVSVVAADPAPGLHVRSNSMAAFRRVVEAVLGKDSRGRPVRSLGGTQEYAYIRTLMPAGDESKEDGLFYLSDPFIRRLVGPELKLTERRRLLCYNHLRMIGHAALLFRTEQGRWPSSLGEMERAGASPGAFGRGALSCPDGGSYSLSADATAGSCSRHGHALRLTPNIEIPVSRVSGEEANEYLAFLEDYNRYWRVYFDPIAIRLKVTPAEYRAETIILPLIDNSIYTGLASALGGEAEPPGRLPVPRRNIFSAFFRLNKQTLLKSFTEFERDAADAPQRGQRGGAAAEAADAQYMQMAAEGLGNQLGLHIYDAEPTFDLNAARLLGLMVGSGAGGAASSLGTEELFITLALASLNTPVYLSAPARDAAVVDRMLERLDAHLAISARRSQRRGRLDFEQDFFKYRLSGGQTARAFGFRFGPAKLRFFWARVGRGLYVASKPFILEDLAALEAEAPPQGETAQVRAGDEDPAAHAEALVRAYNWQHVLNDYRLSWAENEREACINNLGPLADAARALTSRAPAPSAGEAAAPTGEALDRAVLELADRLHAVRHFCPDGGQYRVAPDGRSVSCTVHGTAAEPRQPTAPSDRSAAGQTMRALEGASAALTFTEDGLRAVLTVRRKAKE